MASPSSTQDNGQAPGRGTFATLAHTARPPPLTPQTTAAFRVMNPVSQTILLGLQAAAHPDTVASLDLAAGHPARTSEGHLCGRHERRIVVARAQDDAGVIHLRGPRPQSR